MDFLYQRLLFVRLSIHVGNLRTYSILFSCQMKTPKFRLCPKYLPPNCIIWIILIKIFISLYSSFSGFFEILKKSLLLYSWPPIDKSCILSIGSCYPYNSMPK